MKFIDFKKNNTEDEKEYVVYRKSIAGYVKICLNKKQLKDYINKEQLADLDVYKTKDEIKLKRTLEIVEANNE